ncbi:phage tail sheath family protein [Chengkuizengella sp. SCS-71B]|uniref:phage tail sheath family protein n=1 Tax=Chengkuizengella sp. SCS-71B TaxID=3115290 RepID=UPI0032C223AE
MASGTWSETNRPVRPGSYMNIRARALGSIQSGTRGVVAIPVKANWGPVKEIAEITSESELIATYGSDITDDFTAYECIRLILLGSASKVLAYRLADSSAAKASVALSNGSIDTVKLETKYETTRDFNVTVRDNLVDSNSKDIVLYEGNTQLYVFTVSNTISADEIVDFLNAEKENNWITAQKLADGTGLQDVANISLANGDAGVSAITNADYITATSAFEANDFNEFTLDGAEDAALKTSVVAWINRLRTEGKMVQASLGGSLTEDTDINNANTRSALYNHEAIKNVGVSAKLDGKLYSSAKVACFIAGLNAGQSLRESLTYAVTPFEDVSPRLTHNQVVSALQAGTIVLVHDGEKVVIEQGINTLTSLNGEQNNSFKKCKAVRVMDAIKTDTSSYDQDNIVGKLANNEDGQAAFLSSRKQYFETLVQAGLINDFTVEVDQDKQTGANGDEFYWKWEATIVDMMEKIYGTGNV